MTSDVIAPITWGDFCQRWNALFPMKKALHPSPFRTSHLFMRSNDDFWRENWQKALELASKCKYLVSAGWFSADFFLQDKNGYLVRILEGEFSDERQYPVSPRQHQRGDRTKGRSDDFDGIG